MAEDNVILHFSDENNKRQLYIKKIKLKDFPELHKIYDNFFNKEQFFFNTQYKKNEIAIGKLQDNKEKEELIPKLKNYKGKNKKYLFNSSKVSNSRITYEENSLIDKKRAVGKLKDSVLKVGQEYIEDNELEDLFQKYKIVHKINKSKTKNFLTVNDLVQKKLKMNSYKKNKKKENIKYNLIKAESSLSSEYIFQFHKGDNNEYNKTLSTCLSNVNLKSEQINESNSLKNINTYSNYNAKYSLFNKMIPKTTRNEFETYNSYYVNSKNIINKMIRKRNQAINRQNQYLINKDSDYYNNKSRKKFLAELLNNQEQTLLASSKSQKNIENLSNKISKKINKSKKDLLILNTDNYRIKYELLNKMVNYNKYLGPEHYYNWYNDLRSFSKGNYIDKKIIDNIRNPIRNDNYIADIKKKFKSKNLRKIINDVSKASHNYEGLLVKGQNLLNLEHEYAKSLKNKKIIKNIEAFLPTKDVEDKYFSNKDKNKK